MYAKNGSEFLTLDLAHHWKGYKPAEDSTSIGICEGFCKNTYLVIKNSEIHISNTHRQLDNDGWMEVFSPFSLFTAAFRIHKHQKRMSVRNWVYLFGDRKFCFSFTAIIQYQYLLSLHGKIAEA